MKLKFSDSAQHEFEQILLHYPDKEAALLPTLHLARREFKIFTPDVMKYVAALLELAPIQVLDAVSFYTLFPRQEEGKYVIQVCATLSCALLGAESVVDYLKNKLNIDVGETTPDRRFTLKKVECLGSCGTAAVMQINEDYYENLTEAKIDQILAQLP